LNPKPREAQLEGQKRQEKQEDHLEEGKPQKLAKYNKSSKAKQNGKEELRKTQNQKTQNSPYNKLS
jgi:hypothetical protein